MTHPKQYYHPRFREFMMWSGALVWATLIGYVLLLAGCWLSEWLWRL